MAIPQPQQIATTPFQQQMPVVRTGQVTDQQLPWAQQWQKYLQGIAAFNQQQAQQLHNLSPWFNNPLVSGQPLMSQQQMLNLRMLMGGDQGGLAVPNWGGSGQGSLAPVNDVAQYLMGLGQ
jgi:hypothetical protein